MPRILKQFLAVIIADRDRNRIFKVGALHFDDYNLVVDGYFVIGVTSYYVSLPTLYQILRQKPFTRSNSFIRLIIII